MAKATRRMVGTVKADGTVDQRMADGHTICAVFALIPGANDSPHKELLYGASAGGLGLAAVCAAAPR